MHSSFYPRIDSRRGQIGVALVAVMWLTAALALLVSGLVASVRVDLRGAQNVRTFAEQAALGDAAIRLAVVDMLRQPREETPEVRVYEFEGRRIEVRRQPAAAWINLNTASIELLRDLFVYAAGLSEREAQVLAERVQDWRDGDDGALPNGAESAAYEAAGSPFRPRNGPFETNEDLLQVLGIGFELYDKVQRFITVQGAAAGVDPRHASAGVLNVLAAGNAAVVERIVGARMRNDPLIDMTGLTQQHLGQGSGSLYRIEAIHQGEHARFERARWVDVARPDPRGFPWRELAAEPVHVQSGGGSEH